MDRLRDGTLARGERMPQTRLTAEQVCEIRRLTTTHSDKELGERFGVSSSTINSLRRRITWKHLL